MGLNFLILFGLLSSFSYLLISVSAWTCQNSCGGVPVQYPFGTGWDCGSQLFQNYVNCSHGRLQFYTPTGTYYVQSIDYDNNLIVIQDPYMSTCSYMQKSGSFGLPVSAPFSVVSDTFVLLGCSSSSSLYNPTYLCNPSGFQICQSLYNCPAVGSLGLSLNSPISSCCVYSRAQLPNQPFQINLALLQCSSYTSIYNFGPQNNKKNPSTWSYGITLRYYYERSEFYTMCDLCQQTNGVCAFNIYGFVCVCNSQVNTSTHCSGGHLGKRSDEACYFSAEPFRCENPNIVLCILQYRSWISEVQSVSSTQNRRSNEYSFGSIRSIAGGLLHRSSRPHLFNASTVSLLFGGRMQDPVYKTVVAVGRVVIRGNAVHEGTTSMTNSMTNPIRKNLSLFSEG